MSGVVVLRQKIHGMDPEDYADRLRERLPDHEVTVATQGALDEATLAGVEVISGRDVDASLLERARDLRLFACVFAGTDHLPLDALADHGVAVTSAAGVHGPNVAEHVLGSILVFVRRFREGWRREQRRSWRAYQAHELAGSTVTVVGLGSIGTAVVDRLDAFDVETVGVRHSPEKGGPTDVTLGYDDDLFAAFADTDYLVLTCPLTDQTRGLVDRSVFETLPPSAVLVNVARGPVVDTPDLVEAVRGNAIRGAALDVTDPEPLPADHPLWTFENVAITPHNAGHTPAYYDRLADVVAENVARADDAGAYEGLHNQVQ